MRVIQSKYTTTGKAYIVTTKQASDTENQKEKDLVIVVHYLLQLYIFLTLVVSVYSSHLVGGCI